MLGLPDDGYHRQIKGIDATQRAHDDDARWTIFL